MDIKKSNFFGLIFSQLLVFLVFVGFVVRIILMFHGETQDTFSFTEVLKIFSVGLINDIALGVVVFFFMWLNIAFSFEAKYNKPVGYIILSLFLAGLIYSTFFNSIFHQYGGVVPKIAQYFFLFKTVSFALRLFVPKIRENWSKVVFSIVFCTYIFSILFNAISEYFFWNEFGVRYNFIAVDYLIYTNEVIGNIMESYPIIPMFTVLVIVAAVISFAFLRKSLPKFTIHKQLVNTIVTTVVYAVSFVVSCFVLAFNDNNIVSSKIFVNELQANGIHRFYKAFMDSKLDYKSFYLVLDEKDLCKEINGIYGTSNCSVNRQITSALPEKRMNVVLITIESMSASFFEHFGNDKGITPNLDKLMDESLIFNKMYATGNRTVRGLEAVTLSLPPCPGESIVKQPDNGNLSCTGDIFKKKGYTVQYLYGGDSYFDNMGTFVGGNGYQIVDKKSIKKEDITFENIWGVCDEDLFNNAVKVFNANHATKKPFFAHIMTVSNHRPFTYPAGKIDIPNDSKSRDGGVKYTDYAVGEFFKKARKEEWFKNTIFVITADHCASSSGKIGIPLDKYHIPALIYAPYMIKPQKVDIPVSQIDLMPTLFSLLDMSYQSKFYGKDILAEDYVSRAFVATYQDMGYLENNILTVLSPTRKVNQYDVLTVDNKTELKPRSEIDQAVLKKAIMYYQSSKPVKLKK